MALKPRIFFLSQLALAFAAERVDVAAVRIDVRVTSEGMGVVTVFAILSLLEFVVVGLEVLEGGRDDSVVVVESLGGSLVGVGVRDGTAMSGVEDEGWRLNTVDVLLVLGLEAAILTMVELDGSGTAFCVGLEASWG